MTASREINIVVNGLPITRTVAVTQLLIDFLREDLNLTGTNYGCGQGLCGCCTVVIDGRAAKSCLLLAVQTDGSRIDTIEGLAQGEELHPLQQAFIDCGAVQCGYCTPGMIMTAKAFLDEQAAPGADEIREELSNNLCRCTGYVRIVQAVQAAAAKMSE